MIWTWFKNQLMLKVKTGSLGLFHLQFGKLMWILNFYLQFIIWNLLLLLKITNLYFGIRRKLWIFQNAGHYPRNLASQYSKVIVAERNVVVLTLICCSMFDLPGIFVQKINSQLIWFSNFFVAAAYQYCLWSMVNAFCTKMMDIFFF